MIRIGTLIDVEASVADAVAQAAAIKDAGYDSAWANQIFGQDALTSLTSSSAPLWYPSTRGTPRCSRSRR